VLHSDVNGNLGSPCCTREIKCTHAANKFLRLLAVSGRHPKNSTPVPPAGFFLSCALRQWNGRVLTASAIHYDS